MGGQAARLTRRTVLTAFAATAAVPAYARKAPRIGVLLAADPEPPMTLLRRDRPCSLPVSTR